MVKIVFTLILFLISVSGTVYLTYPLYGDYSFKLQEIEVQKEDLSGLVTYINSLKRVEREIERNEENFEKIKTALPEDHDAPSLFLYLKNTATESNVKTSGPLGSFTSGDYLSGGEPHARVSEVNFPVSIEGSYNSVKNFLRETEGMARVIEVKRMSISLGGRDLFLPGTEAQTESGEIGVNLEMRTFSY